MRMLSISSALVLNCEVRIKSSTNLRNKNDGQCTSDRRRYELGLEMMLEAPRQCMKCYGWEPSDYF